MVTKRSPIEIVHEILQLEGRRKTHIMYATALTYPQAMRYLNGLIERGLIARETDQKGGEIYRATESGRELSSHLDAVIESLGLGVR